VKTRHEPSGGFYRASLSSQTLKSYDGVFGRIQVAPTSVLAQMQSPVSCVAYLDRFGTSWEKIAIVTVGNNFLPSTACAYSKATLALEPRRDEAWMLYL
jgi:hypothetical protein